MKLRHLVFNKYQKCEKSTVIKKAVCSYRQEAALLALLAHCKYRSDTLQLKVGKFASVCIFSKTLRHIHSSQQDLRKCTQNSKKHTMKNTTSYCLFPFTQRNRNSYYLTYT